MRPSFPDTEEVAGCDSVLSISLTAASPAGLASVAPQRNSRGEDGRNACWAGYGDAAAVDGRDDHAYRDQLARAGQIAANARLPGGLADSQLSADWRMTGNDDGVASFRSLADDEDARDPC